MCTLNVRVCGIQSCVAFFMKIFRAWFELGQWMHKDEVIHDGRCAKLHTKGGLILFGTLTQQSISRI